jgi:hypothetical protein
MESAIKNIENIILYSVFFMLFFLILMPILSIFIVNKSSSLSSSKTNWPFLGSLSIWFLFFIGGFVFILLDRQGSRSLNHFLWLWWSVFGTVPAIIQGLYAIRRNVDSRYFARLRFVKLEVKLQYLKQLQDKWSSQLTWFMTIFVAIGISGVLAIINLAESDSLKSQYLYQWLGAFGYGFVGVLFGVFGQIISIINRIIDKTAPP